MTKQDKNTAIAALEELKGECTGIIAATIEDCQTIIRQLPETGGWIPVALGFLPEEAEIQESLRKWGEYPEYLVAIEGAAVPNTLFYWGNNTWVDGDRYHYKVTHWQPLPAMPGKETAL